MTLALTLFCCWLSLYVLAKQQPRARLKTKLWVLCFVAALCIYPFVYSPVWWLRGLTGDLSISTLCLLAAAVYHQLLGHVWLAKQEQRLVEYSVVALGLVFYPLALGLSNIDPYLWGYAGQWGLQAGLCIAAAWALWQGKTNITIVLMVVLLAWHVQWLQSANLWDYLLDPFIFFFYLGRVVKRRC